MIGGGWGDDPAGWACRHAGERGFDPLLPPCSLSGAAFGGGSVAFASGGEGGIRTSAGW